MSDLDGEPDDNWNTILFERAAPIVFLAPATARPLAFFC
jgi:hypothetical protein